MSDNTKYIKKIVADCHCLPFYWNCN